MWVRDLTFFPLVESNLSKSSYKDPEVKLKLFLKNIKKTLYSLNKSNFASLRAQLSTTQATLEKVQELQMQDPHNKDLIPKEMRQGLSMSKSYPQ